MKDLFITKMSRKRDETFQKITDYGKQTVIKLEELWLKIFGESEDVFLERYDTILTHMTNLFDEMLKEELDNFEDRREALTNLIEISKELSKELAVDIKLPQINIDGKNLRQQIRDVQIALEGFRKLKDERLSTLEKYKAEEEALCLRLGEIPLYSSFAEVPSEAKLKEIKSRILALNSEKSKKAKTFKTIMNEIEKLISQLEIQNDLNVQQQMVLENQNDLVLSGKQLEELSDWKKELLEFKEQQEKEIESLKDKTTTLWNRLDVGAQEREPIILQTANKGCGKSVLKIWQDEYDRCEHLKIANIKEVILRLRNVIAEFWDQCHIGDEERNNFTAYFDDDFNEELLEAHEKEETRLRKYFEETKELYTLAKKWFTLWEKMLSLENRSTSINRYKNRGGELLKEEKERKAVQKELPLVESKLEKLVFKYEKQHNRPFLYNGAPLMEVISAYWENRRLEKENEKEFRKIQNQTRVTPMKPTTRSGLVLRSPSSSSSNRKRVGGPLTPLDNFATKRQLRLPDKSTKKAPVKRRSRSHDQSGRIVGKRNLRSNSANSSAVSYNGFQDYLEIKNSTTTNGMPLRSSVSPIQVGYGSTTKNASTLFKTPTSVAKSATKRTRLPVYGASKVRRPMIN